MDENAHRFALSVIRGEILEKKEKKRESERERKKERERYRERKE